jgi:flagellar protein FliL
MPDVQVNAPAPTTSGDAGKVPAVAAEAPGTSRSKGTKRKGLVGVVLLTVAAAGIYFWSHSASSSSAAPTEPESTFALETFVVNLDGAEQRAYLRVGITLGLSHPPRKKDDVPVAPLRDAILSVLSTEEPEQLLAAEGKQKLKADLLKALQERAPDLGIEDVYFTEFLVQM